MTTNLSSFGELTSFARFEIRQKHSSGLPLRPYSAGNAGLV